MDALVGSRAAGPQGNEHDHTKTPYTTFLPLPGTQQMDETFAPAHMRVKQRNRENICIEVCKYNDPEQV